jgi:glycosyltransferase involved in cell wall biosynthesis
MRSGASKLFLHSDVMVSDQDRHMRVLFLPLWYPHRYDPMPGLFVQRQAEAVSVHCDVSVLYVHEDHRCENKYEMDDSEEKGIHVVRVYYKMPAGNIGIFRKPVRLYRFFMATWLGFRKLRNFNPDLLHVHVLTREGFIALIFKIFTGVPYIITEHWSRYFPQNGTYKGLIRKDITGHVVHFASAVIAVSEKLKKAMMDENLRSRNYRVIPNPVDMDIFKIKPKTENRVPVRKKIIHISCFEDKSKNISGFLKTVRELSLIRDDFECHLIGDGPEWKQMKELAGNLGLLEKIVFFPGLKAQDELVSELNSADFLVLSSNYETFASVIIESLACGVPVVATDVGIVNEVVNEQNGLIVPPGDPVAMKEAIVKMLDRFMEYDRDQVRGSVAERFSSKVIGEKLFRLYQEVRAGKSMLNAK